MMEQMNYKLYFGEDSPILHQSIRVVPPNTTKQHAQAQAPHHETCTEEVNVCGSLAETGLAWVPVRRRRDIAGKNDKKKPGLALPRTFLNVETRLRW